MSDYIDALKRIGYFKSVDLKWVRKGSNQNKDDQAMRTFALSLQLDPEAEARPVAPRIPGESRVRATASNETQPLPAE